MPENTVFNLTSGQAATREMMLLYCNTGTSSVPVWALIGAKVENADTSYDWSVEKKKDIIGQNYFKMKKPDVSQTFDSVPVTGGDTFQEKLYTDLRNQNISSLMGYDMLIVHKFGGTSAACNAERYAGCCVQPTSLGGDGGGELNISFEVDFGGEHTLGTVAYTGTVPAYTAAS